MPEGHLYHRLARNLREFSGGELAAWSPQGRFAEGAARIDGARLEAVEAHGKHLLVRFAGGRTVSPARRSCGSHGEPIVKAQHCM